jgi:hypothetical protein
MPQMCLVLMIAVFFVDGCCSGFRFLAFVLQKKRGMEEYYLLSTLVLAIFFAQCTSALLLMTSCGTIFRCKL